MSKNQIAVVCALLLFVAAAGCDLPDSSNVNTTSPIYRYEPGRILVSGHVEDELMKNIIENMNSVILVAVLATQIVYLGDYFIISPVSTLLSLKTRKGNTGNTTSSSTQKNEKAKKQDTTKQASDSTPPVDQVKVAPSKATNNTTQTLKGETKEVSIALGGRSVAQATIPTDKTPSNEKDGSSIESKKSSKRARKNKRRKAAKKIEKSCDDGPRPLKDKITKVPAVETDKANINNVTSMENGLTSDNNKNYIRVNKRSRRGKTGQNDNPATTDAIEQPAKETKNAKSEVPHKADKATISSKQLSSSAVKPHTVKSGDAKPDKNVAIGKTKTVSSSLCNQQDYSNNNSSVGVNGINGKPRLGSSSGTLTSYAQVCKGSVASRVESSQDKKTKTTSSGLKTIHVPTRVASNFLGMAKKNTNNNIETFGALCGKMDTSTNAFALTHLVIPKQQGTPDSCEPTDLEELVAVQDKHGLIMIGWIHTHPTQTAFLSSVDCHTQCNYQMMLPEMLAIVCSPRYNETGYFHLDPEHGLSVVAKCNQTGFHPHEGKKPLFKNVGHIEFQPEADITSIDLRAEK